MDREVLDRWCERGILGLVLAIMVSMPLAFGGRPQIPAGSWLDPWLLDPFLLAQWLLLPVLLLWVVRLWANPRFKQWWPPVGWLVLAFLGYAMVRWRTAEVEYVARLEVLQVLVYTLVFFAVITHLHRQETTQIILFTLIGVAALTSFYALYQFVTGSDRVWYVQKPYPHRGAGTYICPNHLAGFLEMLLPLGITAALMGRHQPHTKILLGYAALVILAGITVTVSRGSWISTLLVLGLLFAVLTSQRAYRIPAVVIILLLVGAAVVILPRSETFQTRVRQLFIYGRLDDDARFTLWRPAVRIWGDHLLWGSGPGHFDHYFRIYRPEEIQASADHVHNDFLNLGADWGVAGFLLVAAVWGVTAWGAAKTWRFVRQPSSDIGGRQTSTRFGLLLGATLGLAAIAFHSVVDFNMYIPANALLMVWLLAVVNCQLRFATERHWVSLGWLHKLPASALLLAAVGAIGWQSTRHAGENYWRARAALIADPATPAKARDLERALAWEPANDETAGWLGEVHRLLSEDRGSDYVEQARQAIHWFDAARHLNPLEARWELGRGWCLDWIDREAESGPAFSRGEELDPNGYFTMNQIGLHYMQTRDYAAAQPWFERSAALYWLDNPVARSYLDIIERNLLRAATNAPGGVFEPGVRR